jgi:predicted MFS family arabinose efflux permease
MKPSSGKEKRNLFFFLMSHFCTSLNFAMWRSVYNNFLHDDFGITESERGKLAAIRELPGLVTALFAAGGTAVAESAVGAVYILLVSLGTLAFVFAGQQWSLIFALVVMSTGVHLLMPIRSSISLSLGEEGAKAKRLGQVGSVGAAAALAGSGLVILMVEVLKYDGVFITASVAAAVGMIAMLFVRLEKSEHRRNRFAVKRKYSLYYILSFLDACRRHIFVTFAPYGLVKIYGVSARTMATLFFINNAASTYTRQVMGRLIDRFGERKMLTLNYSFLIFVFLGYAYVSYVPLLYVLYCLDNIAFGFSAAMTTYLGKIAAREDVTAGLAFGVTLNHISAIALLPTSGYLWGKYGYEMPFLVGIGILVFSMVASSRIRISDE